MRLLAAALALSLLSACSMTRIAYDYADVYLRWRIGNYLDVEGQQSEELDERIDDFMAWHRARALPQYVQLLEDAAQRVERGLTPDDVKWAHDASLEQGQQALLAGAERLAPLLDRLSEEQLKYFERGITEDNRRFVREQLRGAPAERRERRAARTVERLEDWIGRLSAAQVERVRLFSERAPLPGELLERDRQRLQKEIVAIVRARQARERLGPRIAYWRSGREPAYAAVSVAFRAEVDALILDVDRSLTPEQRARAVRQLRRLAQDLRSVGPRKARTS